MVAVPSFPEGQIESLARVLGNCGSGTDISRVLKDRGLVDNSGESTKWQYARPPWISGFSAFFGAKHSSNRSRATIMLICGEKNRGSTGLPSP